MALGLGALTAAALPPFHFVPLLIVAFTGWQWLLDGTTSRRAAFWLGWWFGVGHFAAGLHWIAHSFLTDPERFGWMIPFALGGLSGGLALFTGLAALTAHTCSGRTWARVVVLAAAWTLAEWLRGWTLTGFPWNLMATVWVVVPEMVQGASVVGAFGLSFATVFMAASPAVLGDPVAGRRRWGPPAAAVLLLFGLWGWGAARLDAAGPAGERAVAGVMLRLVQPNIDQTLKWVPSLRPRHVADQMALSTARPEEPGDSRPIDPTHVIWSETALPFYLEETANLRRVLAKAVPDGGILVTGARRRRVEGGRTVRLRNSLLAVDPHGDIVAVYDKHHLVPFGEYVPFKGLPGVSKIVEGAIDYSPGPGPRTLSLPGLPPVSPLICYEVIFPGRVVDPATRPRWLLNLTNDAWFGLSPGPYQHFAAARLRAVEEGIPLVRVANTGISGVVGPYGRVVTHLGLGQRGAVDSVLPDPLAESPPFAGTGPAPSVMVAVLILVLSAAANRYRQPDFSGS